jgi:DNA-binding SARP family transcriptional activator
MARRLQISVLGELRVALDGRELPLSQSKKTRALLAYLAVAGRPQRRERLCELFW